MKKHLVVLLAFICLTTSCVHPDESRTESTLTTTSSNSSSETGTVKNIPTEYSFRDFIKKFEIIDLPFKYRSEYLNETALRSIDPIDTLYLKDPFSMYYGMISDTSSFYYIVTLLPGDDYVPILNTFDKKGNLIDTKSISGNGCGGGPCIHYSSSTSMIDKDLRILCIDTIITSVCDQSDNPIKGTDSIFATFFRGQINDAGKIFLNKGERTSRKK